MGRHGNAARHRPGTEKPPGGAPEIIAGYLGIPDPRANAAETRLPRGSADDPEKPQAPPLRDMKRPRWGGQSRGCRGLYRGRVTTGRDPGQEVHRDLEVAPVVLASTYHTALVVVKGL